MGLQKSCNAHKMHVPGTWRSLVARFLGVEEVASSNLAVPTTDLLGISRLSGLEIFLFFTKICPVIPD
jgi:hypothetical protein